MRSGVCGPRVCELRRIVVIDTVEAHAAIRAVLIFHYHRHGVVGAKRDVANRSRASRRSRSCFPRVSEGWEGRLIVCS